MGSLELPLLLSSQGPPNSCPAVLPLRATEPWTVCIYPHQLYGPLLGVHGLRWSNSLGR